MDSNEVIVEGKEHDKKRAWERKQESESDNESWSETEMKRKKEIWASKATKQASMPMIGA